MAFGKKQSYGKGKGAARARRHVRLRKHINGTAERPRLVVKRSSRHVFVPVSYTHLTLPTILLV